MADNSDLRPGAATWTPINKKSRVVASSPTWTPINKPSDVGLASPVWTPINKRNNLTAPSPIWTPINKVLPVRQAGYVETPNLAESNSKKLSDQDILGGGLELLAGENLLQVAKTQTNKEVVAKVNGHHSKAALTDKALGASLDSMPHKPRRRERNSERRS